jgi:hypothetical protein
MAFNELESQVKKAIDNKSAFVMKPTSIHTSSEAA